MALPSPVEGNNVNIHSPLQSATSIRLLHLKRAWTWSRDYVIEGSLTQHELSKAPAFEALSYTWGDGILCKDALINKTPVKITLNLWEALSTISKQSSILSTTLWVDALCISQTDLDEKAQQVSIIGSIFSRAQRVRAWVGQHKDDSRLLFDRKVKTDLDHLLACHYFMFRSYWSRTWIIQEITLAQAVVVHCGSDSQPWEELFGHLNPTSNGSYDRFRELHETDSRVKDYLMHFESRIRPLHIRRGFDPRKNDRNTDPTAALGDFSALLWSFRESQCCDPLDKVYALLSLSTKDMELRPDYTLTPVQLFMKLCVGDEAQRQIVTEYEISNIGELLKLNNLSSCLEIVTQLLRGGYMSTYNGRQHSVIVLHALARLVRIATGQNPIESPQDINPDLNISDLRVRESALKVKLFIEKHTASKETILAPESERVPSHKPKDSFGRGDLHARLAEHLNRHVPRRLTQSHNLSYRSPYS
jgi:Heterokaryon incompatibility protein (HET)